MGTTLWAAFLPQVIPHVAGVSDPMAEDAIKQAAIEFCQRSLAWQYDHDPVTVAAGVNPYDYSPPANTQVIQPLQAWFKLRRTVAPKTPQELADIYGDWRSAESGDPRFITQTTPTQFYLVPMPVATDQNGLTMRVALKPSRAATGLDSGLYEEYLDEIAKGARARLLLIPGKPWSSPALGAALKADFEDSAKVVRIRVLKGFGKATPTTKAAFF